MIEVLVFLTLLLNQLEMLKAVVICAIYFICLYKVKLERHFD